MVVGPEAEPIVTLPERAPLRLADAFVQERQAWIARHVARAAMERARLEARPPLGEGRGLDLVGVAHELEIQLGTDRRRSRVEHEDVPAPVVRVRLAPSDPRPVAVLLEAWLRAEARTTIARRVAARAPQLGVAPVGVTIRDQRTRWGSASRAGRLSFSWRLILAPPAVLDYVVVHELAHLAVFGHSPRFWALVRSVVPEADRARRWLREHARELHWAVS